MVMVFFNASQCHLDKLQVLQNQALRVVPRVPSYVPTKILHDASGISMIKDHLLEIAKNRIRNLKRNPLVKNTIDNHEAVKNIIENQSPLDVIQEL